MLGLVSVNNLDLTIASKQARKEGRKEGRLMLGVVSVNNLDLTTFLFIL